MSIDPELLRQAEQDTADAFGVPVEILRLSDAEFHWWLHNTIEGQSLLGAAPNGQGEPEQ